MTDFRGFDSENQALRDARAEAEDLGYRLSDLCTCNAPVVAHVREKHDETVTAHQARRAAERKGK